MAKIISLLFFFSILSSEIIETNQMEDLLPYICENTYVLLDLGDTLLESKLEIALAKKVFYEIEGLVDKGYDLKSAVLEVHNNWVRIEEIFPPETSGLEIPGIVTGIQESAGSALGLTHRHHPISTKTLKQLAYIGINFTFSVPEHKKLEVKPPVHWEGGVLFLTSFNHKGEIFRKWLKYSHFYPKNIILIDDGKENLVQLEEEMAKLGMPFTGFHYTKPVMHAFDPKVAEREHLNLLNE